MTEQQEYQQRLEALLQKANSGNADAQYALALITARQNKDISLQWLARAVSQSHPAATHTLGLWHIQGLMVPKDVEKGRVLLEASSNHNFPESDMILAVLDANGLGSKAGWSGAVQRVIKKAREGYPRALGQLAFLCFMLKDPKIQSQGARLLKAAALGLDMLAAYAYAKQVLEAGKEEGEVQTAQTLMTLAAQKGRHPLAIKFPGVEGFKSPENLPGEAFNPDLFDWDLIAKSLAEIPIPEGQKNEVLKNNPHIEAFPSFCSKEETDYLIGLAARNLTRSNVVSPVTGKLIEDPYRTSSDMRFWPAYQDLVVFALLNRIAGAAGEPVSHQEMLGVLCYEPGQEYKPHGDFFMPDFDGKNPEVETSGQRKKTFLIYLNEDFEGGETEFVNVDFSTRGKKGDGLMFINITEHGDPNPLTVHAGKPVVSGLKWLGTMWIRERPYHPGKRVE